ncbi:hypothetical protein ACSFBI_13830 [Variovorax sp. RB3P1]|uniref:hypothetical protein n=1 Tax=Variovorax sp. RB3P1 TaxID=3443732 RepID=UPI003F478949
MSTAQLNSPAGLTEGHSALTKSALLASHNLAETCATLALARACSQLRLAVTNYERIGCGSRVTQPLRDAIASIEASFHAAQSGE